MNRLTSMAWDVGFFEDSLIFCWHTWCGLVKINGRKEKVCLHRDEEKSSTNKMQSWAAPLERCWALSIGPMQVSHPWLFSMATHIWQWFGWAGTSGERLEAEKTQQSAEWLHGWSRDWNFPYVLLRTNLLHFLALHRKFLHILMNW